MKRSMKSCMVLALTVLALGAAKAEPVKLAYKFTAGEVDKYKLQMTMSMNSPLFTQGKPMTVSTSSIVKQQTLEVLPDGSAKIQMTTSDIKVTGSAIPKEKQSQLANASSTVKMTIAPDGKVSNVEGLEKAMAASGANMDMSPIINQLSSTLLFPKDPVEAGATWSQSIPIPGADGQVNINSTLLATNEPIWSENAARIKQSYNIHMGLAQMMKAMSGAVPEQARSMMASMSGSMDMTGTVSFLFSPARGKVLKGGGSMSGNINIELPTQGTNQGAAPQMSFPMDITMSMTRFK